MPAYTVAGRPIGDEGPLRLRGFPGGSARAGNRVRGQFQLDAAGETLSLLAAAARHDLLTNDDWRAATVAADLIGKRWRKPDAGMGARRQPLDALPARMRVSSGATCPRRSCTRACLSAR